MWMHTGNVVFDEIDDDDQSGKFPLTSNSVTGMNDLSSSDSDVDDFDIEGRENEDSSVSTASGRNPTRGRGGGRGRGRGRIPPQIERNTTSASSPAIDVPVHVPFDSNSETNLTWNPVLEIATDKTQRYGYDTRIRWTIILGELSDAPLTWINYFLLMFPEEEMRRIADLTTSAIRQAKPTSDITVSEFKKFLGIMLAMALNPIYGDMETVQISQDFGTRFNMSFSRFSLIYNFLTFSEDNRAEQLRVICMLIDFGDILT
jgi:hypothetical protein